jgi:hypothetical protein
VVEKRDENWAHFEGQMIDCYLVLDTRKNPINKKQPKFVYWWIWDIYLNDEYDKKLPLGVFYRYLYQS